MMEEGLKETLKRVVLWLPEPKYTRFRNLKLFDWMNQNAPGKIVLNLGSGVGQFDHNLSKGVKAINLLKVIALISFIVSRFLSMFKNHGSLRMRSVESSARVVML
jgi:hypothetical protein